MDERMKADLICDALQMALWQRRIPKGVLALSDRGSQYCSRKYQALLTKHELVCSMSGKAWGPRKSLICGVSQLLRQRRGRKLLPIPKVELAQSEGFATREDMHRAVFEYIGVD